MTEEQSQSAQATTQADENNNASEQTQQQSTQQQADGNKAEGNTEVKAESSNNENNASEGDSQKEGEKGSQVPENYELKRSEDSLVSKERLDEITEYAKQKGLSNEEAQELVSRDEALLSEYKSNQAETWNSQVEAWAEQVKEDKEMGGDNYNQTLVNAKAVIDRFASDELKEQLDKSGYGNHPELMRFVSKIGKAMENDKFVHSDKNVSKKPKTHADILYPQAQSNN